MSNCALLRRSAEKPGKTASSPGARAARVAFDDPTCRSDPRQRRRQSIPQNSCLAGRCMSILEEEASRCDEQGLANAMPCRRARYPPMRDVPGESWRGKRTHRLNRRPHLASSIRSYRLEPTAAVANFAGRQAHHLSFRYCRPSCHHGRTAFRYQKSPGASVSFRKPKDVHY